MANFNNIKNEIDQNVNTNGVQAITGAILNTTLKDMLDEVNDKKQDTLVAGQNITISGNVISATGGGSGPVYTAGQGINIDGNNEISVDPTGIAGNGLEVLDNGYISPDFDVVASQNDLLGKQDTLTAGANIQINGTTISATDTTYGAGNGLNLNGTTFSVDTTTIQAKLSAGSNIQISPYNVISATDTTYSAGSGILIDGNNEISADTSVLQPKLTAGSGISISAQNVISATGGGGGASLGDGDAIHIDSNDNINVLYGNGLQLDGNGALEVDTAQVASDIAGIGIYEDQGTLNADYASFRSYFLPLDGGQLQDPNGDTELTVIDGYNEDYIKLEVNPNQGHEPHIEIFENASGDTKFFYDHIERGSQVSIDLPSSSGTIALTSDIPTASSLAGNGLQDDGNGQLEVDTTVIQEKLVAGTNITISGNIISASGGGGGGNYLPLDGGVLSDTTGNATTALNITPATGQVGGGTVFINSLPSVQVGSNNSANGYTHIRQNAIHLNDGNGNDLLITNTGFDDGTYTASLPTLTQNEILATQSDVNTAVSGKQDTLTAGSGITIQNNVISATGGGGSGLWTNGTGTNSLMTPDAVSSGSTASGTAALNAGHYDSSHNTFPSSASGNYSAVFGTGNTASGTDSFVAGEWNKAQGQRSAVIGGSNGTASGLGSVIVGGYNATITANGEDSVAVGGGYVSGMSSVAIKGRAESANSVAIGGNGETHAASSVAIGGSDKAYTYGAGSIAIGTDSTTDGADSVALGLGSRAKNSGEVGIGQFNKSYQSATSSVATQFTVGNGTTSGGVNSYSNSIEVKKNNDIYVVGIGGFDGTNSGTAGVETLQDVINNGGGGGGTNFTPGIALELDANDNLNVLYGSGLTLSANNELEVDPSSITGFLPLEGGDIQNSSINNETVLRILDPDTYYSNVILVSNKNGDAEVQVNTTSGTTAYRHGEIVSSGNTFTLPSTSGTLALLSDIQGGGSYLPLTGGTLQDTAVGATETLLDVQAPDSTSALSFSADTLSAMIQISADRDDANVADGTIYGINYDNSGDVDILVKTVNPLDPTDISTTTYTQTFQQKSGTIALLSDISGGGTSYTAGTGISISAQNVISNSAPDPGLWVAGTGTGSIRTNNSTSASGQDCVAIGKSCTAGVMSNQTGAVSLGYHADAKQTGEVALGKYNKSTNTGTTAEKTAFTIGNGASAGARSNLIEAKQNNDIYVVGVGGFDGTNAGTSGVETLQQAIANAGGGGSSLWTSGTGTDSLVAPATITAGLSADPAPGTGAISCGYDTDANGDYSFACGGASEANGDYSFVANNGVVGQGADYSAAFNTSGANGYCSFAAGDGSTANATKSIALAGGQTTYDDTDPNNIIDAEGSVAIGNASIANAYQSIAIGDSAHTSDTAIDGIAIGTGAYANAQEAVAIGPGSTAEGQGATALSSSTASGEYSGAMAGGWSIGNNAVSGGSGAIASAFSSAAFGFQTMTYDQGDPIDPTDANAGETALGRFNYTEQDIIFSVGCGQEINHDPNDPDWIPNPDDPDSLDPWTEIVRENAITITNTGSIYIKGLGGYSGKTVSGSTDLQTLLANI